MEEITVKTLDEHTKRSIWKTCLISASHSTKNADDLVIDLIRAYSIIFSKTVLDHNPYRAQMLKRLSDQHRALLNRSKGSSDNPHQPSEP